MPFAPAERANVSRLVSDRFDADWGSLRYKLFIPSRYSGAPLPLIVMLHGGGQDADDFASGTGMNELAEKFQCLVAYPDQSHGANCGKCWNWFDESHQHRGQGEPALIAGVTQKIVAEYAVDPKRVFVAGLSAGGAMAVILGRTYPDLYTAVGCHSGLAHASATDSFGAMMAMRDGADLGALPRTKPVASVPIIVFHGDLDATVHLKNSVGVVQQSIDSHVAQNCHGREDSEIAVTEETGETSGRGFTRKVHRAKTGEIVAEQWTLHGTGHAWSGGRLGGSFTDTNGPNASEEMLRFFMQR
jgi:poly(hydroxyalkanoate) depolymerase family esterase